MNATGRAYRRLKRAVAVGEAAVADLSTSPLTANIPAVVRLSARIGELRAVQEREQVLRDEVRVMLKEYKIDLDENVAVIGKLVRELCGR